MQIATDRLIIERENVLNNRKCRQIPIEIVIESPTEMTLSGEEPADGRKRLFCRLLIAFSCYNLVPLIFNSISINSLSLIVDAVPISHRPQWSYPSYDPPSPVPTATEQQQQREAVTAVNMASELCQSRFMEN